MKTTGERIREARTTLKLTQTKLGDLIGVAQSTVALWENDDTLPSKGDNLDELSKALKTDPEYLIYGIHPLENQRSRPEMLIRSGVVTSYIGENQTLHPIEQALARKLGRVTTLSDPDEHWNVAVVRGNTMLPLYRDGDMLFYRAPRRDRLRDLLGLDCFVWDEDDNIMVKRLMAGSTKQVFTLVSPNSSELQDVRITKAAPVEAVRKFIPTQS